MYTIVYVRLKRNYGRMALAGRSTSRETRTDHRGDAAIPDHDTQAWSSRTPDRKDSDMGIDMDEQPLHRPADSIMISHATRVEEVQQSKAKATLGFTTTTVTTTHAGPSDISSTNKVAAARQNNRPTVQLRKMLLLNGYPILYILLWIPGIAERVCEAIGVAPLWLQGLQATTQFMGLGDVLTYAYNEQLHARIQSHLRTRRGFQRSL